MNKGEIEQEIADKMAKKLAKEEEAKRGKKLKLPSPKGRKGSPKRGNSPNRGISPKRGASPNRGALLSPNVGNRGVSPNSKKPKSKSPKRKDGEQALQHINDESKLLETRMYSQNINMPVQK